MRGAPLQLQVLHDLHGSHTLYKGIFQYTLEKSCSNCSRPLKTPLVTPRSPFLRLQNPASDCSFVAISPVSGPRRAPTHVGEYL